MLVFVCVWRGHRRLNWRCRGHDLPYSAPSPSSATDRAGNTGSGSTSFTVIVTAASLDNLITQFFRADRDGASGLIAVVQPALAGSTRSGRNPAQRRKIRLTERRGRDLNPRRTQRPVTVFETAAFDRPATPPSATA